MKLQALILTFCLISLSSSIGLAQGEAADKNRDRLEMLFIWKASEALKLPPEQEQKFTQVVHELNARKKQMSQKMDEAIKGLDAAKTKAESEKALKSYRDALKNYNSVSIDELDRMKPLLGVEKLARYLVVKSELSQQLKALLSGDKAPEKTPTSTPKIIEEK